MNTLKIVSLDECGYSMAAEELINNIKKNKDIKIKIDIKRVSRDEKDNYKKNNNINSFPQIYINNKSIGGYDDLNKIYLEIIRIKSLNLENKLDLMIKFLEDEVKGIERFEALRLIEFFI